MQSPQFFELAYKRMLYLWWLKALGVTLFMAGFFYCYFAILESPAFPTTVMPATAIDLAIAFHPIWFYVYLSLWVYTALVPALMPNIYQLLEYGFFIGLLCLIGLASFYVFPSTLPFSSDAWPNHQGLGALRNLDQAGNAFPSLHVASAVFSTLSLRRVFLELNAPNFMHLLNLIWCLAIVFSTLAIKQHVLYDVVAGFFLALIVYFFYSTKVFFFKKSA